MYKIPIIIRVHHHHHHHVKSSMFMIKCLNGVAIFSQENRCTQGISKITVSNLTTCNSLL